MKKITIAPRCFGVLCRSISLAVLMYFGATNLTGQCTPVSSTISGSVFADSNFDGVFSDDEDGVEGVIVKLYDATGGTVGQTVTDQEGDYTFDALTDGSAYQVRFSAVEGLSEGFEGRDNASSVQNVTSPACGVGYGLTSGISACGSSPEILLTCFVQDEVTNNQEEPTLVGLEYDFNRNSPPTKYATHAETGSIWGLAWNSYTGKAYSSAFVKFNTGLKSGPYAIFETTKSTKETQLFTDVNDLLGGKLTGLANTTISDCAYGQQVGRVGLGSLVISPDQKTLYTSVLDNNTIVSFSVDNPQPATTKEYVVPKPAYLDEGKEWRIFALTYYKDLIYVGVTVTAAETKSEKESRALVYTLDPSTGVFDEVFSTNKIKGYWQDESPSAFVYGQWLTDIDFADEGYMILGLTDRIGHMFCDANRNHRLDQQYPDILGVWYDTVADKWKLESNGKIGDLTGSGADNKQGPDGGEFFAYDFWPTNPEYHPETALGSVLVLPGTHEVVAMVYDPLEDSYSGGLHRYSTIDGSLVSAKQLYSNQTVINFGKATGFGDVVATCEASKIEIGNLVWFDVDGNGIQTADELGIFGVPVVLLDDKCNKIAETTTDAHGHYLFNDENVSVGLKPYTTYYIEIASTVIDSESNTVEIANKEYGITKATQGADGQLDSDLKEREDVCTENYVVEINVGSTSHDFDIGLNALSMDLALIKKIKGSALVQKGGSITFEITVYNQGHLTASKVDVIDYVPSGFTFDAAKNPKWTNENGKIKTTIDQRLGRGESTSVEIVLDAVVSEGAKYTNAAEISAIYDLDGNPSRDIDSTPDEDSTNDAGGLNYDDYLDGNGTDDEDDHDTATPELFDLALRITPSAKSTPELSGLPEDLPSAGAEYSNNYYPGDIVTFDITVFNQGNTDSEGFTVVQYYDSTLVYRSDLNGKWVVEDDLPTFESEEILKAGESRTFQISFEVSEYISTEYILSYAEISYAKPVDHDVDAADIDSTPDATDDNDAGGQAFTRYDDFIDGDGKDDEDDHDVVAIGSRYVDLALQKTVAKARVRAGEKVPFIIKVYNQGTQPVDQITISDYIPEGLTLVDESWTMTEKGSAKKTLTLDTPLYKDGSVTTEILLEVDGNVKPGRFINFAEISSFAYGDKDLSSYDIDSQADDSNENDRGGLIYSETDNAIDLASAVDEDDHDPAVVFVIEASLSSSVCLNNATTPTDGQYQDTFKIISPTGDGWYVDFVQNYYEPSATVSTTLVSSGATPFAENVDGDATEYVFVFNRTTGERTTVTFRNINDDTQTFDVGPTEYDVIEIEGAIALCTGRMETYTVANPIDGVEYTWELTSGGTLSSTTGTTVDVEWTGGAGYYDLNVTASDPSGTLDLCIAPATLTVAIGQASEALACHGNINISLDSDCSITVTPEVALSGDIPAGAAYAIMLTDEKGEVIPNATLTAEYLGQKVTAKVIDGCTGNSCWTTILVEDKIKPTILCQNTTLACNKVEGYRGPFAQDNCGGDVEIVLLDDLYEPYDACDTYIGKYIRTYQAIDRYGNKSETCDMEIEVERVTLADIDFPDSLMVSRGNPLDCSAFDADENGNPHPTVTGRPSYKNQYLYPDTQSSLGLCNIATAYSDVRIPEVGTLNGVVKIMRTWTVFEWCSTPMERSVTQIIEIVDTKPPVITECPDDLVISATDGECGARVTFDLPTAYDSCSAIFYDIHYPGGVIADGADRTVVLPASNDPYKIVYTVRDEAGYEAICESYVTVVDSTPPTPICLGNIVVSLDSYGTAYLPATVIDNGSWDPCGIDSIKIRRMGESEYCGISSEILSDKVKFCCEDAGKRHMVELVVWDRFGNRNSCMVEVEVQDKYVPTITTLPDVTIQCYDELYPLSQFGTPTYTDACEVTLTIDSTVNINNCRTGEVVRTFTVSDAQGSSTSTQTIYVVNDRLVTIADLVEQLPADLDTTGLCTDNDLNPDNLPAKYGTPIVKDDQCRLVGITYKDEVYPFGGNDNTCFKIVRTWSVADWCQSKPGEVSKYEYLQIIKVSNTVAPEVTVNDIPEVLADGCDDGQIRLTATGDDDCTADDELEWTAEIDFNIDGVVDTELRGRGATADATGRYPLGTHRVTWTFSDACNNQASRIQDFTIKSGVKPVIACANFSVGLTPMDSDDDGVLDTEMATFNVDTLLSVTASSTYHPCGTDFELSLDSVRIVKVDTFDCSTLGVVTLTVYAIDIFGNRSECSFTVDVQDNNGVEICRDLKRCVTLPDPATISTGDECNGVIDVRDYDLKLKDGCTDVTFTHDVPNAPSNTTLEGATFPIGTTVVTWTITGASGMSVNCDYRLTVIDRTAPELSCTDRSFEENADGTSDCQYSSPNPLLPTITDNCDTDITLTHNYKVAGDADYTGTNDNTTLEGAVFPLGVTDVRWTAEDTKGNTSICIVRITVTDEEDPSIVCNSDSLSFTVSSDGTPDCAYTVVSDIQVFGSDNCNGSSITATHDYTSAPSDTTLRGAVFPVGDTNVTFTVTDEGGNTATCSVVIAVTDDVVPTIDCQGDTMRVQKDENCLVTTNGINPTASDNCTLASLTHDYRVAGMVGYTGTNDNTTLDGAVFDADTTTVTWTATDSSGLMATCSYVVIAEDRLPPVCTTQDTLMVNIDTSGVYTFTTSDLSDPIVDNCDRMLTYQFFPATIECDRAGDTLTVEFTVTDSNGNVSERCSMVAVVNDGDEAKCDPRDITVALDEQGQVTIRANDINNLGTSACGDAPTVEISKSQFFCNDVGENVVDITVVFQGDTTRCSSTVTVTDTVIGPKLVCGGDSTITCEELNTRFAGNVRAWIEEVPGLIRIDDNCPESPQNGYEIDTTLIVNINACGVGQATRTYFITDSFGMTDQCVQIFMVTGGVNFITQDDIDEISLTSDTLVQNCVSKEDLEPNNDLGQITLDDFPDLGSCQRVSISYRDSITVSNIDGGGCEETIKRIWTVIDSCQMVNNNDTLGRFMRMQTIMVRDTTPPMISVPGGKVITLMANSSNCMAEASFDGIVVTDCNAFSGSNDSPHADSNDTFDPSGQYPVGVHDVVITAVDTCGNMSRDSIRVIVTAEESSVTFSCQKIFPQITDDRTVTTSTKPEDYVEISGACGVAVSDYMFSFNRDNLADTTRIWTCADLDSAMADTIYRFDLAGNFINQCFVLSGTQDPNNLCPEGSNRVGVSGSISNTAHQGLKDFEVTLYGSKLKVMTDENGNYTFPMMEAGGQYSVVPSNDQGLLDGVDGLDIVKIQRHILGLQTLDSPYKLIAADINNDQKVSAVDLLALRKAVLGLTDAFPNNKSWRAIDAAHIFVDDEHPWGNLPESYDISSLTASMAIDFIGIKTGDVDDSYNVEGEQEAESRSKDDMVLELERGISTAVYTTDARTLYGMQFSINSSGAEIKAITSDLIDNSDIHYVRSGDVYNVLVTIPTGIDIEAGERVLDIELSEATVLTLDNTKSSEVFAGSDLDRSSLSISYRGDNASVQAMEVLQNRPNPWSSNTVVTVIIPEQDVVTLTVFDITGKVVAKKSEVLAVGAHDLTIDDSMLSGSGVYYYEVRYKTDSKKYKMIKLE